MSFSLQLAQDLVEVEAGTTSPVTVVVINRGDAAERFELEVEGIDAEWKAIPVPAFTAEPGENHSERFFLKPPRASESQAGNYPFVIRVRSLESGEQKTVQGMLRLKPFHHLSMEISPKKGIVSPTVKRNSFGVTVVNLGNTEHTVQLIGNDPEDVSTFEFEHEQVTLGPGQQREVEVTASPTTSRVIGGSRLIGFSITARSIDVPSVVASAQAQLEQRSAISPAAIVVVTLFAMLIGAWWMMMPKQPGVHITVSPMRVQRGEQVTVRWTAHDANRVVIKADDAVVYDTGDLSSTYSFPVTGHDKTLISVVASREGRDGPADTRVVDIDEPVVTPEPEISSFKASSTKVKLGTSFVLSWSVNEAVTKVAIVPVKDDLDPALQKFQVTPTQTEEYQLVAFNRDGKIVRSKPIRVEVFETSDATILAFTATPPTVTDVEPRTTLSWQTSNAERVELKIDGGQPQSVESTGSQELALQGKSTFTLTAYDSKGRTVLKKVVIDFTRTEPPTIPGPTETTAGTPADPAGAPVTTATTTGGTGR